MKTILPLFVLFLFSCNRLDKDNTTRKVYYEGTDKLMQTIEYKNGKKNGAFIDYYRNGNIASKQFYVNDTITDSAITYHENGSLAEVKIYNMGKKEGVWKTYNKNGMMYREVTYKDNRLDGPANKFTYTTGKTLERLNYVNGQLDGRQEYYHNNGQKKAFFTEKSKKISDLEEWNEKGKKIDNDIKFTFSERNNLLMENKITLIVRLSNPTEDDEVFETAEYEPGVFVKLRSFQKVKDHFEFEYFIPKGRVVMQKLTIAARRKSYYGYKIEKRVQYNFSATNY